MSGDGVERLIAEAEGARRAGQGAAATELLRRAVALAPEHPRALFLLGQQALAGGAAPRARALFEQAAGHAPGEAAILFHVALAARAMDDAAGEMAALDRALALDPDYLVALMGKAQLLERSGRARHAARIYKDALALLAGADAVPPQMQAAVAHARNVVAEEARRMQAFLEAGIAGVRARHGGVSTERVDEALGILAGTRKFHVQHPELLAFPRLPAIPFFDRAHFPWIEGLEAEADAIRGELLALFHQDRAGFSPYVAFGRNEPLRQWADLNHSPDWNAYYLWKDGARLDDHCARCPKTAAALERVEQVRIDGYAPTAFFSVLAPRMHLPAHAGSTNIRLTAHLPLILPGPARFRVGNVTRTWQQDEAWVFDDTIEHEAWNEADAARTILIFDVWNPLLTAAERALSAALLQARRAYYRDEPEI